MTLPLGSRVGEFEIEAVIGEGGFGVVYLALDRQLGRQVALKEYMPASLATRRADGTVAARSETEREAFDLGLRSFVNEARMLAQFDHPALVKVHRFWEEHGTAYMVMPYYRGQTLRAWLDKHPPPDEAWLRRLLAPALDGLQAMHARQCLHRDIAPDNILLLEDGRPLLIDFGAARQVIGEHTQALTVILKPGYAPIEQYAESPGMKQGPWTDVYALCAVLYRAICGRPPRASVARMMEDDLVPAARAGAGRYSPAFLRAIDAGLTLQWRARPRDVAAWRALLDDEGGDDARTLLTTGSAATPAVAPISRPSPPPPPPPAAPRAATPAEEPLHFGGSGRPVAALLGVAALLAIAGAAWWWSTSPPAPAPPLVPAPVTQERPLPSWAGSGPASQAAVAPAPATAAVPDPAASDTEAAVLARVEASAPPASAPEPLALPAATLPRPRRVARPAPASEPSVPQYNAADARCAELLQRLSMGEDSPALRERLRTLNCS